MSAAPFSPSLSSKRFLRIIYADDVYELRELARISFSRDGHGIECVPDGEVALQRISADSGFDLVLTDHHMPRMNGLELVTQLRAMNYPGRIVVLSSEIGPSAETEYRRLQVDAILYKPVYPAMLRKVMAQLFPNLAVPAATVTLAAEPAVARR